MQLHTHHAEFDFIVVGGGSAGCVVAARLAQAGCNNLLVLEAGDTAEQNPVSLSAEGFADAFSHPRLLIDRLSVPQDGCGGRSLYAGSGTGMGGSGAVNGMVYTRGDKKDYAAWPAGWQWQNIEPSFAALEQALNVQPRKPTAFTERFVQSAAQAGFTTKHGLNDGDLCGFMGYQTMNYQGSERRSSYAAMLKGQHHAGLRIETCARVERLVFDAQHKVIGVRYRQHGVLHQVRVKHEVILCAGALETPRLLLLSGIGPAQQLAALGISVQHDSPAVGQHLQDHPNVCIFYRGKQVPDLNYPQVYGFARARPESAWADQQADTCYVLYAAKPSLRQSLHRMLPAVLLPVSLYSQRWLHGVLRTMIDGLFKISWFANYLARLYGVVVILGKTRSRGSVTLVSADPAQPAQIDLGFFSDPEDLETLTDGVFRAGDIQRQSGMQAWGADCLIPAVKAAHRARVKQWITRAAMTTFHYCGSCRMGDSARDPVDTRLAVKGVTGVRVADASVIPEIPVSAINAPTMMIGWRAADFIVQDHDSYFNRTDYEQQRQSIQHSECAQSTAD